MSHIPLVFQLSGTVRVTEVRDGDTIKVMDDKDKLPYTVRLYRVDAPEIAQPYGEESKRFLEYHLINKKVRLLLKQGDFFGPRIDCEVFFHDGTNVNEFIVKSGMAWWYEFFDKGDIPMRDAQEYAKVNKIGLWKDDNPTPPWDYRKQKKEESK